MTGLLVGTPVVAGAGDVACSALGAGVVQEGVIYLNVGTAAQVSTVLPSAVPGNHFVFGRADSEGYLGMASVYAAGLSVDWAARTLLDLTTTASPPGQQLTQLAQAEPVGARGVTFVPHLLGTSVPTHDPEVRGSLFGLGVDTDKNSLARAVLEGVAYACVLAVQAVAEIGGGMHRVHLGGGLSRSAVWREAVSATLGAPVSRVGDDASARGAAMLAALGTGLWASATEAARACVTADELPPPPSSVQTAHRLAFDRYEMTAAMQLQWTRRVTQAERIQEDT
jgi:xylulokinase